MLYGINFIGKPQHFLYYQNVDKNTNPAPLVERFSKNIKIGPVLDIGFGNGRNAVFLARMGFDVTAIDVRQKAIDAAKELAKNNGVVVNFLLKDVREYVFPKKHYQAIIALNSLFFLGKKDFYAAIDNIKKTLIVGGIAILSSFTVSDSMFDKIRMENEKVGEREFKSRDGHFWYFLDHDELLRLFDGFEILFYKETLTQDHGHPGWPEPHTHAVARIVIKKN